MERLLLFFIKDKLVVNLILMLIVVAGIWNVFQVNREIFPATDMDSMSISIDYPGASAKDVEINALLPVEEKLKNIYGIKDYVSVAVRGGARVSVELDEDATDLQAVKDEIFRSISLSTLPDLSEDVEEISVVERNSKRIPVLRLALAAKAGVSREELFDMAAILEKKLAKVDGVSEVSKSGYLDKQVHIEVNPERMEDAFVAISDIVESIRKRNIRVSSGSLQSNDEEVGILSLGEFSSPKQVGEVIIRSGFEQKAIRVSDIADVIVGYEESDTKTLANGLETIVFTIRKMERADSIETVEKVFELLKNEEALYNEKYKIIKIMDTSASIKSQIDVVALNALIGFILVLIVLFIFLDFRTSFWTAVSIPLCLLLVIIFIRATANSINIITIGALITVLGMLVDDAIVIAETIYYHKERGMNAITAALTGVKEVAFPVIVTIVSTIIAFLPMLMIEGRMGKFIKLFPIIIMVALTASLAEALFLLPNHLAHAKVHVAKEKEWYTRLQERYQTILRAAINKRYLVLFSFVLLLVLSVVLASSGMKKFKLSRDRSSDNIRIDLSAASDTSLDEMTLLTKEVEDRVNKNIANEQLISIMSYIGQHSRSKVDGNNPNWSYLDIILIPSAERKLSASMIVRDLRTKINKKKLSNFTDIVFVENRHGPATGNPVDIKVSSLSSEHAIQVVDRVMKALNKIEGVKDISSDLDEKKSQIVIEFNYEKLAEFGLTASDAAATVRTAYAGSVATTLSDLSGRLEFVVRLDKKYAADRRYLSGLLIPNTTGDLIRLGEVAHIEESFAESSIRHYNGELSLTVSGDVDDTKITPLQVNNIIEKTRDELTAGYPDVFLQFKGEAAETNEALWGLAFAFGLAIVCIYLIVLMLFRSFGKPLIVMSVVPFGLIGVLLAFWAHGVELTFMAVIGVVGLSGVVVNDSIIMVEFISKVVAKDAHRGDRLSLINDITRGAARRLRPILLTTITTVVGLMPTVYGVGGRVETLIPSVMAMAYGLLFATMLTLFFVPVLYMIGEDVKRAFTFQIFR